MSNARRRRNPLVQLVVALVALALVVAVLATVAFVADTVARKRVETTVEQKVTQYWAGSGVQVTLPRWGFLWQMRNDRLDTGRLTADEVTIKLDGKKVTLRNVNLEGRDLTGVRTREDLMAAEVTGAADISWDAVRELSGVDLAYVADDRMGVSRTFSMFGQDLSVSVEGTPQVDPATGVLSLDQATASVGGAAVPQQLLDPVMGQVEAGYPLPQLGAMQYQSVEVSPEAVRINLAGTDIGPEQLVG